MEHSETQRDRLLKEAFEYRLELVAYARALLGNYAAAEDAVQEAMLVVTRKYDQFEEGTSMIAWCRSVVVKELDQFEEGTSMLAWCRAIVRLEVLRAKQRTRRDRTLAQRVLDDAIDAAFEEFQSSQKSDDAETWREALERCLQRIPDNGRRVLKARFVQELRYEQIGEHVGMSLEAVRKSLYRLKKQVRSCVENSLRGAP